MITVDNLVIKAKWVCTAQHQIGIDLSMIVDDQLLDCRLSMLMKYLHTQEDHIESGLADVLFKMARLIKKRPHCDDEYYGLYNDSDLVSFFQMVQINSIHVELSYSDYSRVLKKSDIIPFTISVSKGKHAIILKLEEYPLLEQDPYYWVSLESESKRLHLIDGYIIPELPEPLYELVSQFNDSEHHLADHQSILDFFEHVFIPYQDQIKWVPKFNLAGLLPEKVDPIAVLKISQINEQFVPTLLYRYKKIDIAADYKDEMVDDPKTRSRYKRSLKMESIYQEDLMSLFLENHLPFLLESPGDIACFQQKIVPILQDRDWVVISDAPTIQVNDTEQAIELSISSAENDWFYFESSCEIDGQTFSVQEIAALLVTGHGYIQTKNGYVRISERSRKMMDYLANQKAFRVGQKMNKRDLMPVLDQHAIQAKDKDSAMLLRSIKDIPTLTFPNNTFLGELRDYQERAVQWLYKLYRLQQGAVLADDMGLGKTIQTIAFLSQLERDGHFLVVCPTNVVFNWEKEINQFGPQLNAFIYTGSNRSLKACENKASTIITSFGILKNDQALLQTIHFDTIIIDEGQFVKNHQTKLSKAIKSIQSRFRIILTGTPIENHIHDLWNLLDITLPNYMGTLREFDHDVNNMGIETIQHKIRPFILRRKKEEVLDALPEKNEFLIRLKLNEDQQAIYKEVHTLAKKGLMSSTGKKQRMHILTSLLKLRQICNHPKLIKEFSHTSFSSSKCEYLMRHLSDLMGKKHQVVIFSQFTKMLDILEKEMGQLNVPLYRIDGSVPGKRRAELIETFQNANSAGIFLISLKAGGTGITLTAADYVFHVDPWWNPAVENQATDRIYRIGQTKRVFVYKLVSEGTIEEKIHALQENKRAILEQVLDQSDDSKSADKLSLDELKSILL